LQTKRLAFVRGVLLFGGGDANFLRRIGIADGEPLSYDGTAKGASVVYHERGKADQFVRWISEA